MKHVTHRLQVRFARYLNHEVGWLAAATVLTPVFHMGPVPEKLKPFAEIVSKVSLKKAAAAYLKNAGGVKHCASLMEFTEGRAI